MKKLGWCIAAMAAGALWGGELLTPASLVANYSKNFKSDGFSLQDQVVKITALPAGKLEPKVYQSRNRGQKFIMKIRNIKPADVPNSVLKLEFETKITKLSGRYEVCVRIVQTNGKSWGYPGVTFRAGSVVKDWKKYSKTIKVPKNGKDLYFFVWARNFAPGDDVQLRQVKLTKIK